MWPRVGDLRSMELGRPGGLRRQLTDLVLAGTKTATAGLVTEYQDEGEELETVGERLALLDDAAEHVATLEVTRLEVVRFADVTWEFADAEGEGFTSVAHWAEAHRRFWVGGGTDVDDDSEVVCLWFRVVEQPPSPAARPPVA